MAKKGQRKARFLTDGMVERAAEGTHFDAARTGLYLLVRNGHKNWYQSIRIHGKRNKIAIGNCYLVTAEEARQKAVRNREIAKLGGDPRNTQNGTMPSVPRHDSGKSDVPTFEAMAERVIGLKSPVTGRKWQTSFERHVYPAIGHKPLDQITRQDIKAILEPHWTEINPTMRKTRQRISEVFEVASVEIESVIENPAGNEILKVLPTLNECKEHRKALSHHEQVSEVIQKIRNSKSYIASRLCLEFAILTAARSGEARKAEWKDVDLEKAIWTVPGPKHKEKREHKVPLSKAAIRVLEKAKQIGLGTRQAGLIFPSQTGIVMDGNKLSGLLNKEKIDCEVHGFRTNFSVWANESGYNPDAVEISLSHKVPGVRGAYMRAEFIEERTEIMEKWGEYIA